MKYGEYELRVMERKRSLVINVRHTSEPHSHDIIIEHSLLGVASGIINAVLTERKEER